MSRQLVVRTDAMSIRYRNLFVNACSQYMQRSCTHGYNIKREPRERVNSLIHLCDEVSCNTFSHRCHNTIQYLACIPQAD